MILEQGEDLAVQPVQHNMLFCGHIVQYIANQAAISIAIRYLIPPEQA